eukprot:1566779-Alexandrium_andersonii.AAC.1
MRRGTCPAVNCSNTSKQYWRLSLRKKCCLTTPARIHVTADALTGRARHGSKHNENNFLRFRPRHQHMTLTIAVNARND